MLKTPWRWMMQGIMGTRICQRLSFHHFLPSNLLTAVDVWCCFGIFVQIIHHADLFENKAILLIHFSARYQLDVSCPLSSKGIWLFKHWYPYVLLLSVDKSDIASMINPIFPFLTKSLADWWPVGSRVKVEFSYPIGMLKLDDYSWVSTLCQKCDISNYQHQKFTCFH